MTVFLFPGQGVVDEKLFARTTPWHHEYLSYLENLLGEKITSKNYLNHTINSPLTVASALACFHSATENKSVPENTYFAGYSVGHFAALSAAGLINWKSCIDFVFQRSKLMLKYTSGLEYTMLALIGPDQLMLENKVAELTSGSDFSAAVTNYNSPINHTLAGKKQVLEAILGSLPKEKVVKALWLENLGAWHSPALNPALDEYRALIDKLELAPLNFSVMSNVTGSQLAPSNVKEDLLQHLVSPVKWNQLISDLREKNQKVMFECGESGQLSKMIFFTYRDIKCKSFKEFN